MDSCVVSTQCLKVCATVAKTSDLLHVLQHGCLYAAVHLCTALFASARKVLPYLVLQQLAEQHVTSAICCSPGSYLPIYTGSMSLIGNVCHAVRAGPPPPRPAQSVDEEELGGQSLGIINGSKLMQLLSRMGDLSLDDTGSA